jgi:hypothetical protein
MPRRPKNAPPLPDEPITAEVLGRKLPAALGGKYPPLTPEDYAELAGWWEMKRRWCCRERGWEDSIVQKQTGVQKARDGYRTKLYELRSDFAEQLALTTEQEAPRAVIVSLVSRLAWINRDLDSVDRSPSSDAGGQSYLDRPGFGWTHWQVYGPAMAEELRTVVRRRDPEFAPGIANAGPIARVLEVVIPLVTGEKPTIRSVSRQLRMSLQVMGRMLPEHFGPMREQR